MKIFNLKNMIGLAAIAGVVHYARKQGGFGQMLEGLMNKAKTATEKLDARAPTSPNATSPTRTPVDEPAGYGSSSYGDYGIGDNSTRRS